MKEMKLWSLGPATVKQAEKDKRVLEYSGEKKERERALERERDLERGALERERDLEREI